MAYQAADIDFDKKAWRIYTASIDAPSNAAPCGWGCVVISPGNEEMIAQGVMPAAVDDRQRAELMAAIRGLRFVQAGANAIFVTDSPYVNEGVLSQKTKSLSKPSDNPLDLTSLWAQFCALLENRTVNFGKFSSATEKHADRAFELAQEASAASEAGIMPLSTSSFTEFEAAGSPGSMTVSPSGCGVIVGMAMASLLGAVIISLLWKIIFS